MNETFKAFQARWVLRIYNLASNAKFWINIQAAEQNTKNS